MAFSSALHPHVPAGSTAGGQFAPKAAAKSQPAKKPAAKRTAAKRKAKARTTARGRAPLPRNGRYSPAQFRQLQALEKSAHAGHKLTPAQAHALHVATTLHKRNMAARAGRAVPKAKGRTVKRVTVRQHAAAKPRARARAVPVPVRSRRGVRAA